MALPEIKDDEYYLDGAKNSGLDNRGKWRPNTPLNRILRTRGLSTRAKSGLYALLAYDKCGQLRQYKEAVVRDVAWLKSIPRQDFMKKPGINVTVGREILEYFK